MCDYTQVEFRCGHVRYTVRAWCTNYETTHKRCPPSVVAIEFRYVEQFKTISMRLKVKQDSMSVVVIAVLQR
jgi:hypothetical protein